MCEPTNEQRREWAQAALKAYAKAKGECIDADDLTDLLADLMHLAGNGDTAQDFDQHLETAKTHYEAEKDPE